MQCYTNGKLYRKKKKNCKLKLLNFILFICKTIQNQEHTAYLHIAYIYKAVLYLHSLRIQTNTSSLGDKTASLKILKIPVYETTKINYHIAN